MGYSDARRRIIFEWNKSHRLTATLFFLSGNHAEKTEREAAATGGDHSRAGVRCGKDHPAARDGRKSGVLPQVERLHRVSRIAAQIE